MSETTTLIQRLFELGLTQAEIVRRTGIPQPRVSRWAGGESPTGADDALKLAALAQTLELEKGSAAQRDAGDPAPAAQGA